jgi:hypothetical protein
LEFLLGWHLSNPNMNAGGPKIVPLFVVWGLGLVRGLSEGSPGQKEQPNESDACPQNAHFLTPRLGTCRLGYAEDLRGLDANVEVKQVCPRDRDWLIKPLAPIDDEL